MVEASVRMGCGGGAGIVGSLFARGYTEGWKIERVHSTCV